MTLKFRPIPIKLEVDPTRCVTTAFAGIMPYLDLWNALEMPAAVDEGVSICGSQGWLDRQMVQTLVLLNLIGGDCVTDVEKLEDDAGVCAMFRAGEFSGMSREQRREAAKRFRAGRNRTFPAPTQIYSFLESCHNEAEEAKRVEGKAFIPAANDELKGLRRLN